jgi:hypothetical protein
MLSQPHNSHRHERLGGYKLGKIIYTFFAADLLKSEHNRQNSQIAGRDLNPAHHQYKAKLLINIVYKTTICLWH